MPNKREDVNQRAYRIVQEATGQAPKTLPPKEKDAAAQELGAKGGKARAERLTPEQRSEIARNAARKRWGK